MSKVNRPSWKRGGIYPRSNKRRLLLLRRRREVYVDEHWRRKRSVRRIKGEGGARFGGKEEDEDKGMRLPMPYQERKKKNSTEREKTGAAGLSLEEPLHLRGEGVRGKRGEKESHRSRRKKKGSKKRRGKRSLVFKEKGFPLRQRREKKRGRA